MSAVSNSVTPSSSARCTTAAVCSLSIRIPKLLQPSPATETWSPERPTLRYSIVELLDLYSYRKIDSLPPQLGRNSLGRFSIGLDQRKARQANPEADSV